MEEEKRVAVDWAMMGMFFLLGVALTILIGVAFNHG